jgi:hypothetical protein
VKKEIKEEKEREAEGEEEKEEEEDGMEYEESRFDNVYLVVYLFNLSFLKNYIYFFFVLD